MSVIPKAIETARVAAVAKDRIQLIAVSRVTVRTNVARLVGGAGEETIIARIGEGMVSTIGSAATHKDVLENPDHISKNILTVGKAARTARVSARGRAAPEELRNPADLRRAIVQMTIPGPCRATNPYAGPPVSSDPMSPLIRARLAFATRHPAACPVESGESFQPAGRRPRLPSRQLRRPPPPEFR